MKTITGEGKVGGKKDADDFEGGDAAAVAGELKNLASERSPIVEGRAEVLEAVARGELTREQGEGRLRELLAKEDRVRRGHLFATPHTEEHVEKARAQMEKRLLQEAPRAQDPVAVLKKYALWLRCRRAQLHQGIFFLIDPRGQVVGKKDWVASYKPKTDDSKDAFWRGEILCQECLKTGVKERLPYEWVDYDAETFIPNLRHVWKTPKDYATYELEGHSRLADLVNDASNLEKQRLDREIDAREGHMLAKEATRG